MTRGEVQSFIDGFIKAGGDPSDVSVNLTDWMGKHPIYPVDISSIATIVSDLESYRGIVQKNTEVIIP